MLTDYKLLTEIRNIQNLSRKPTPSETLSDIELKALFDKGAEDLRVKLNGLIDSIIIEYASKADLNGVIAGQINTTDATTGKKYSIIIQGGLLGIKEVG